MSAPRRDRGSSSWQASFSVNINNEVVGKGSFEPQSLPSQKEQELDGVRDPSRQGERRRTKEE
jgi:hypothetical protein